MGLPCAARGTTACSHEEPSPPPYVGSCPQADAVRTQANTNGALRSTRAVVERSTEDRDLPSFFLERRGERGAAARTEVEPYPAPTFVGSVLVSGQGPLNTHLLMRKGRPNRESAPGTPLAELAVAHYRARRFAVCPVAHCAAKAASGSQSERPSKCLTGSFSKSTPSRQRVLIAAIGLPDRSAASA